jgi:formate-dependent nitrite reductase membrane component NrfD
MFSLYVTWYVFLAGAGGGAFFLATIMGFYAKTSGDRRGKHLGEIAKGGYLAGPALVAAGTLFLLADLGGPQRVYLVFLSPPTSMLAFGAWSIVIFCLLSILLLALESTGPQDAPWLLRKAVAGAAFVSSLCVMAYTGLFMSDMPTIPFLNSPLLTALFIVCSITNGSAVLVLFGFLNQHRKSMQLGINAIPRIDSVLIVLEALVLAAFCASRFLGSAAEQESLAMMLHGGNAMPFWLGAVGLGIVIPIILTLSFSRTPKALYRAAGSVAILVGGFALRYAIIGCALHITAQQPSFML